MAVDSIASQPHNADDKNYSVKSLNFRLLHATYTHTRQQPSGNQAKEKKDPKILLLTRKSSFCGFLHQAESSRES